MRATWSKIKGFWTAEEVPRWIGLSLVGILLFGLGAVSYRSVSDTRERFAAAVRRTNQDAVEMLAWSLSRVDPEATKALQGGLREFTRWHRCERLRVIDGAGVVRASIDVSEIGKPDAFDPELAQAHPLGPQSYVLPSDRPGVDRQLIIIPLNAETGVGSIPRASEATDASPSASDSGFVQGVLLSRLDVSLADTRMGTAVVVLAVVTLFFVVYRAMRRHFRSMARISENLLQRGDQLEQDIQSLRIADREGALAIQWNRLVDLVEELSTQSRRATASAELKEVLVKSRKGALADVVNAVPDGLLYVVDRNRLAFVNAMARRLMEVTLSEDETALLDDLPCGETGRRILEKVREALGQDGTYRSISTVIEAEGGASSYRLRVLPFHVRRKTGECVVTIADISQQVRADRASEEFVAQLTHELRTPLTNIRAYAETLSSGVFDDPKVISDCYNVITKETRRLSRLIEDILSASQMEVGTIQLRIDDVDMRTLLGDAVRDLRGLADEKQVDMQLTLPSKMPVLRGDRDKLAVVVNNLLGNALKYTQAGGSVHVGCQVKPDEMLVSVKDTGMGIDPADHERIFEKFQRGSNPSVQEIVGTGLGLTTAREITRRHGGDIRVMSTVGEGSTFIVHLPLQSTGDSDSRVLRSGPGTRAPQTPSPPADPRPVADR